MLPFSGTPQAWNELIASLPLPHLLQTWEWSQVKAKYGWQPFPYIWNDPGAPSSSAPVAAAMILKRSIPVGGFAKKTCVLYIPKGPNLDWNNRVLCLRVLADLQEYAKRQGAIYVKLDPDVALGKGVPGTDEATEFTGGQAVRNALLQAGWKFSQDQIQFRNTVLIDLSPGTADLLAGMKQKTRYNIHLAQRKGITVRIGTADDLPILYRMYAETSVRDKFLIREEAYYQTVWHTFGTSPTGNPSLATPFHEPLIAEVAGEPVGAVSLFYFAGQAIYLFGMSRAEHREKMPNYLLQWEAIQRAKTLGNKLYNLWGAPDKFDPSDNLWGVFRFKEGLGGYVLRTLGAWDFTPNPMLYNIYTVVLPRVMDIMRRRGKDRTLQSLGA